jgi:hypothetical protein
VNPDDGHLLSGIEAGDCVEHAERVFGRFPCTVGMSVGTSGEGPPFDVQAVAPRPTAMAIASHSLTRPIVPTPSGRTCLGLEGDRVARADPVILEEALVHLDRSDIGDAGGVQGTGVRPARLHVQDRQDQTAGVPERDR